MNVWECTVGGRACAGRGFSCVSDIAQAVSLAGLVFPLIYGASADPVMWAGIWHKCRGNKVYYSVTGDYAWILTLS